jgi:hypothetical protein
MKDAVIFWVEPEKNELVSFSLSEYQILPCREGDAVRRTFVVESPVRRMSSETSSKLSPECRQRGGLTSAGGGKEWICQESRAGYAIPTHEGDRLGARNSRKVEDVAADALQGGLESTATCAETHRSQLKLIRAGEEGGIGPLRSSTPHAVIADLAPIGRRPLNEVDSRNLTIKGDPRSRRKHSPDLGQQPLLKRRETAPEKLESLDHCSSAQGAPNTALSCEGTLVKNVLRGTEHRRRDAE